MDCVSDCGITTGNRRAQTQLKKCFFVDFGLTEILNFRRPTPDLRKILSKLLSAMVSQWKLLDNNFRRLWSADGSYRFLFFYIIENNTASGTNSHNSYNR
jgi:hypothetical protein